MLCSACHATARSGSRFCPSCGQPLTDADVVTRLLDDAETVGVGAAVSSSDATFPPGTLLAGRYQIVRLLGRGGMGVVYQADDRRLGHPVALKFLPPSLASDPRRVAQFHNEVSVARQVSHPNVCRVYDIGDVDGHLFLSMEHVEGEDLASVLRRRGRFREPEGIELTRQICAGLAAVHARGVLHRDLKPANIMINSAGQAQLMDFGIAAATHADEAPQISEGTPAYMAPELLGSGDASVRSDLYALGLVMYEIVVGHRPFNAATLDELVQKQRAAAADLEGELSAVVRPRTQQAILQCLEPDPSGRPASAHAVAAMLQTVILDARTIWRRVLQVVSQGVFVPLLLVGGVNLWRSGAIAGLGIPLILASVMLVIVELRHPLGWTVPYKGHRIRFYNNPIFGERLYIDGLLADRGRVGLHVTMRGTIESGAGAGERITADVRSNFTSLSCTIVAESFTAAGSR